MITQSPALLKTTLSTDTQDTLEGLFAYDKTNLDILNKPLLRYLPSNQKLYIGQPEGTARLLIIPSTEPLSAETLFEEGWYLRNATNRLSMLVGIIPAGIQKNVSTQNLP